MLIFLYHCILCLSVLQIFSLLLEPCVRMYIIIFLFIVFFFVLSHVTNFQYGHCSCQGLHTMWRYLKQFTPYKLFTLAHVFKCLSQWQISRVFRLLEIFEILICHVFELFWLPKMTSTVSKRLREHYFGGESNKIYIMITYNFYPLV